MTRRVFTTCCLSLAIGLHTATAALAQQDVANSDSKQGIQNAAGYVAKNLASGIFISGREMEDIVRVDIGSPIPALVQAEVDRDRKTVTVTRTPYGAATATAVFRDGLGCTLVSGISEEELRQQPVPQLPGPPGDLESRAWPAGDAPSSDTLLDGIDADLLEQALDNAFAEPDPKRRTRHTRAALVVYRGHIVAERYADGFHRHMPLISHSMTKSITSALVGIRVGQGAIDIHDPVQLPHWQSAGDGRQQITLDHLLRMSSGLEWDEVYLDLTSDVVQMLYGEHDPAAFASNRPLSKPIDSEWYYSSGTTNVISEILRRSFDGDQEAYLAFPREELFHQLGMHHATIEPSPSGVFVGSSFMYCTPRDWARFAMLYLNDGVWNGERILPEGWVEYSLTPSKTARQGHYGAQIWLNAGNPEDPSDRRMPDVPTDAFSFNGFDGQFVVAVPSQELIVVRMGHTRDRKAFRINDFVRDVLAAIEPSDSAAD